MADPMQSPAVVAARVAVESALGCCTHIPQDEKDARLDALLAAVVATLAEGEPGLDFDKAECDTSRPIEEWDKEESAEEGEKRYNAFVANIQAQHRAILAPYVRQVDALEAQAVAALRPLVEALEVFYLTRGDHNEPGEPPHNADAHGCSECDAAYVRAEAKLDTFIDVQRLNTLKRNLGRDGALSALDQQHRAIVGALKAQLAQSEARVADLDLMLRIQKAGCKCYLRTAGMESVP